MARPIAVGDPSGMPERRRLAATPQKGYCEVMGSSLETIKEAIVGLSESERAALAAWLNLNSMDDWDKQMHRDFSAGGRAHAFAAKVREEVREGKFGPMPVTEVTDESD